MIGMIMAFIGFMFVWALVISPGFYILLATGFSEVVLVMSLVTSNVPTWLIVLAVVLNILATTYHIIVGLPEKGKVGDVVHFVVVIIESLSISVFLVLGLLGILSEMGIFALSLIFICQAITSCYTSAKLDLWRFEILDCLDL